MGWNGPDGRVDLKMDDFTTLVSGPNLILKLFPVNERDIKRMEKESKDGIPF